MDDVLTSHEAGEMLEEVRAFERGEVTERMDQDKNVGRAITETSYAAKKIFKKYTGDDLSMDQRKELEKAIRKVFLQGGS